MSYFTKNRELGAQEIINIDETLARSRKIVQESIDLSRKSAEKKHLLEKRLQNPTDSQADYKFVSSESTFLSSPIDNSYYEQKVHELTQQLKNEQYLKQSYEKALRDLNERVKELESSHIQTNKQEFQEIKERFYHEKQKTQELQHTLDQLIQEVKQLTSENEELQSELSNYSQTSKLQLKSKRLQEDIDQCNKEHQSQKELIHLEIQDLKRSKEFLEKEYKNHSSEKTLREELEIAKKQFTVIQDKYRQSYSSLEERLDEEVQKNKTFKHSQTPSKLQEAKDKYLELAEYNKDLRHQIKTLKESHSQNEFEVLMKENSNKIKSLEEKIKETSRKYDQLKVKVSSSRSLSNTRPSSVRNSRPQKPPKLPRRSSQVKLTRHSSSGRIGCKVCAKNLPSRSLTPKKK